MFTLGMLLSAIIFMLVYFCIASEKVDKTIAVILGASAMLWLGLIPFKNAAAAIDFNVIFLLVGMMICINVLAKTGFFEWIAVSMAKKARGNPMQIMLVFILITALISAFLDNVTTIILMAPVTILVTQILEISPIPFLILEALASNIGGAATLIGDPPNILIGSQAELSFNDFLRNLTPCVAIIMLLLLVNIYFLFRKRWNISEKIKSRLSDAIPHLAIIDHKNMKRSLAVLALIILGFATHGITRLEPGIIALCGSMLMVFVSRSEVDKMMMHIEWGVIFFFIGLFMIVAGLEYNGVIQFLAQKLVEFSGNNFFMLVMSVLVGSALFSSILDNIPFVMAMIPIIKNVVADIAGAQGIADINLINITIAHPLWWALALGACLGGNGTLIGASANVVVSRISSKNKYPISFMRFTKYGFPMAVQSIIIAGIYLWVRYFVK